MDSIFSRSHQSTAFRVRVGLLVVVGIFALSQAGRLRRAALLEGIVRSQAPDPALVREVLQGAPDRPEVIHRIWNTGRLPHRWEVMNFLNRRLGASIRRHLDVSTLLVEAATDADMSVRHAAWSLLRITGHPEWKGLVQAGLSDPDDETRGFARTVLESGQVTNLAAAANSGFLSAPGPTFGHLVFHDFKRRPVALSNHLGRPVLLHFFTTWSPDCARDEASLIELRKRLPGEPLMLGVSLDALAGIRHDHGHAHLVPGRDDAAIMKQVERHVITRKYNFPVVFDLVGNGTAQLEGSEMPVHVLLDAEHRLVRRYTGGRAATNHAAIVEALLGLETGQPPLPANSLAK